MVEGTLSFIYFIGLYIGWVQPPKLCSGPYFGLCCFFFFPFRVGGPCMLPVPYVLRFHSLFVAFSYNISVCL